MFLVYDMYIYIYIMLLICLFSICVHRGEKGSRRTAMSESSTRPGGGYVYICVYVYIYIYIHTYIHTHTHTKSTPVRRRAVVRRDAPLADGPRGGAGPDISECHDVMMIVR